MKIFVINGPSINMIGTRENNIYGSKEYSRLMNELNNYKNVDLNIFHSNSEGEIIDLIQKAYFENVDGIIINPGAYTHYSYAIYDAILSIENIPVIEVHFSNVFARDSFRAKGITTKGALGQICGFGINSYKMAIEELIRLNNEKN